MESGFVGLMWRYIHQSLDRPHLNSCNLRIIEVGAGHGQHLRQTKLQFSEYVEVDLQDLRSLDSEGKTGVVKRFVCNAENLIGIEDDYFDLLIASCLLPHIDDVDAALRNFKRVVKSSGSMSIYVPCEPGLFLRALRTFTTKRKIQKLGYDHKVLHWIEHRNSFIYLDTLLKYHFSQYRVKRKYFPFRMLSWNLNLYAIYHIEAR